MRRNCDVSRMRQRASATKIDFEMRRSGRHEHGTGQQGNAGGKIKYVRIPSEILGSYQVFTANSQVFSLALERM